MNYESIISPIVGISAKQVAATIALLDEKATIPFIARYRKEKTGSLDEVQIAGIQQEYTRLQDLSDRKQTVLSTIESQGKLTDDLRRRIEDCWNSTELEDIYLPYKPRRKTRADIAAEKGLTPLAEDLLKQPAGNPEQMAKRYLNENVKDTDEALQGARDIIAQRIAEDERSRNAIRREFSYTAILTTKVVKGKENEPEAQNYKDYFAVTEPLKRISSHRLLAIRRAEKEGFIRVDISPDTEKSLDKLAHLYLRASNDAAYQVELAMEDGYKRLLKPAIETEFAAQSKEKADTEAIRVFATNLRQLLLDAPLGQKRVLALDPGFRTGCKVVVLSAQGDLLMHTVVYLHQPDATKTIATLTQQYAIQAIAIGNGTASRETEQFITSIRFDRKVQVFVVSENGASIYSASKIAREEFPEYDVTVRGAVSIGRRLMDPLAELVKIDPKSIGVGQYQHDVDQTALKKSLDQTVELCVNLVGVNVNTASKHLLTYVSGLGPTLAQNIVNYRTEHGPFASRKALMEVPRMGAKAFEQSAGFLRIPNGENPLDNSAVHPESYPIVERMAKDLGCTVKELIEQKELKRKLHLADYQTAEVGMPTLNDIMAELDKPGRDPRQHIQVFSFDPNVKQIEDLHEGQVLPGIVTNITDFGCFVDVGIKENGLVHISELADQYVSDPSSVVSLHQHVEVRVLHVDLARKRIQLSMKGV